ncbi:MAG: site-2 protease family protein, partial [Planctomycetota bacterium]
MFGFPLFEFILLVLGFGFLIFVHELGHFAVAKWVGIRCPQFAIGFGKAMFSWRKGIGIIAGSTEPEYNKRCIEKLKADGVEPEELVPVDAKKETDAGDTPPKKQYSAVQLYNAGDELGLA